MSSGGKIDELARVDWSGMKERVRQTKPYLQSHLVTMSCDSSEVPRSHFA